MKDFINAQIPSEVKDAVAQKIFSVNQTDKGQGHIIIDFDRLLEHGLGSLLDEMQGLALSNPDNEFYQSVVLLLEASIRHIYRYADLAQIMAEACDDAERKAELVKIANISKKIATSKPQGFYEACQLFWYMNIVLQYESNASSLSLGRFDQYMMPFYQASIDAGESPAFLKSY